MSIDTRGTSSVHGACWLKVNRTLIIVTICLFNSEKIVAEAPTHYRMPFRWSRVTIPGLLTDVLWPERVPRSSYVRHLRQVSVVCAQRVNRFVLGVAFLPEPSSWTTTVGRESEDILSSKEPHPICRTKSLTCLTSVLISFHGIKNYLCSMTLLRFSIQRLVYWFCG